VKTTKSLIAKRTEAIGGLALRNGAICDTKPPKFFNFIFSKNAVVKTICISA